MIEPKKIYVGKLPTGEAMSNDSRQNGDASGALLEGGGKDRGLFQDDGKYSVSLPVSSVAAAGARLSHQTWEHFCHEDQR